MKILFYESGLKVYSCVTYYCLFISHPYVSSHLRKHYSKSHWWVDEYLGASSPILSPTPCPIYIAFPLISQLRFKYLTTKISITSIGFQQVEEEGSWEYNPCMLSSNVPISGGLFTIPQPFSPQIPPPFRNCLGLEAGRSLLLWGSKRVSGKNNLPFRGFLTLTFV